MKMKNSDNTTTKKSAKINEFDTFKQEAANLISDIPVYVSPNPLRPFAKVYVRYYTFIPCRECLLDFPEDMPICKLADNLPPKAVSDTDTADMIIKFLKWLQRDIQAFVKEAFSFPLLTDREIDVLKRRTENETFKSIAQSYGLSMTRIQAINTRAMRRAKEHCVLRGNNLFLRIYALQSGKWRLTRDDLKEYIDAEYVKYLWYMIWHGKCDCEFYKYSKDTDTLDFNI